MIYRKDSEAEPVPGVAPCIVARLADGWQFEPARKCFAHVESGRALRIRSLPPSTRVEMRYPYLAGVASQELSDDDKDLARYVQFVFHPRARLDKHLARINEFAAIESAYVVSAPSLPGPAGPTAANGPR